MEEEKNSPLTDAATVFAHVSRVSTEPLINGIWLGILQRLFPFPQFIIASEHWRDRSKPDSSRLGLFVIDVATQKPVFAYEGTGDEDQIISERSQEKLGQIGRYLLMIHTGKKVRGALLNDRALLTKYAEMAYGVLAQGSQFSILCLDHRGYFHRVKDGSLGYDEQFNNFYDFKGRVDLDEADKALAAIASHLNTVRQK